MKTPTRIVAGGGAAAALLAVGCARPGGDVSISEAAEAAPTVQLLTDAADVSDDEPYRFAITVETAETDAATDEDPAGPAVETTGAFDGERTQMKVDLSRSMPPDELPPGAEPDDLFVETVTDATTMWARAPAFAVPGEEADADAPFPAVEIMEALGEGWITVDVDELSGIDPAWAACVLAGQRAAPAAYLELMRSADDLTGLGSDEIDGDAVGGMTGNVTLADLLRIQRPDGTPFPAAPQVLEETTLPVEVWLDDDGHIRRIATTEDTAETTAALVEADILPDDALERDHAVVTQTVDLWDHGDDEIEVEVPTDAVDMTDMYGLFLLATGELPTEDAEQLERDLAELEALHDELEAHEDLQADLGAPPALPEPPPYPDGYPTEPPPYPEGYPTEPPPYPENYPTEPLPYPDEYSDPYPGMDEDLAEIEEDLAELEEMYDELEEMPDIPPPSEVPEYTEIPGY